MARIFHGLMATGLGGLVGSAGCGDEPREDDPNTTVVTTIGATSDDDDDDDADSTTGDDDDDDADETAAEKLDAPNEGTMGIDPDDVGGCKKVDLLFVIDNSGSMEDEQANLVASFPGFISAMQTELAETDGYNIGVVSTDVYIYDLECAPLSVGNFIVRTGGEASSNNMCGPYGANRNFMRETDNLANKFECAAQLGIGGSGDEHPMEAMLTALSPPLTDDGECNAGFLRDDALLVVVIITDEEDDVEEENLECEMITNEGSPGGPGSWFDDLVALKGGEESSIVVLSIVGPDDEAGGMCAELDKCNGGIVGAEVANRILNFTRRFSFGFIGPVCANDYAPLFQDAIGLIDTACEEFVPPG